METNNEERSDNIGKNYRINMTYHIGVRKQNFYV